MSFLRNYWWATLFVALFLVWAWRTWRRLHREPDQHVVFAPSGTPGPAPFRRTDFQAKVDTVVLEMERGVRAGTGIFLLGVPALFAISWLVPRVPQYVFMIAFIALAAGVPVLFAAFFVRAERLARRLGLRCPRCGLVLVDRGSGGLGWYVHPAHHVVFETGKCRKCGMQLLDPTEVRPASRREGSLFRNLVGLFVLLGLLGWSIYQIGRALGR